MGNVRIVRSIVVVSLLFFASGTFALDPPDSELNPKSGNIEVAEALAQSGNYNIRHIVDPGSGGPSQTAIIANHSDDDLDPRLGHSEDGDTWIVWWRDGTTDEVVASETYLFNGNLGNRADHLCNRHRQQPSEDRIRRRGSLGCV